MNPLLLLSACTLAPLQVEPHGAMLRNPDISATTIVFSYADDLWTVPREGGTAVPLASPPGQESFPRFSPDGRMVVFVGNYDGNRDLYVMPASGGIPRRLTHHPADEIPCEWVDDERILFMSSGLAGLQRQTQLFEIDVSGGLPRRLPVPYGAFGALDAAARRLVYVPHTRDNRTWKRYRGGMATDLWLFDVQEHTSLRLTDWEGTDSLPMWHGDSIVYLSDAGPTHRLNLWRISSAGGEPTPLTTFADFDVKWPAVGPGPDGGGEIVFQHGSRLRVLDLRTNEVRAVDVELPGARPNLRQRFVDASEQIQTMDVGPSGDRLVVEARGDVWTLPANEGVPRNLTRTAGIAERDPAWSPDGKWIAYFADESGEYELYRRRADGRGEPERLTSDGGPYKYAPQWSPDSRWILFADKTGTIYLHDTQNGATKTIDRDPWAEDPSQPHASFSADGRWIALAHATAERPTSALFLYDTRDDVLRQVTAGMFNDRNPVFDREGDFLAFTTSRHFEPEYSDLDSTFIYSGTELVVAVPLRADHESPFAAESDEEEIVGDDESDESDEDEDADEDADEDEDEDEDEKAEGGSSADETDAAEDDAGDAQEDSKRATDKNDDAKPVSMDLEGFEARAFVLPIEPGNFGTLAFADDRRLLFSRVPARGEDGEGTIEFLKLAADDEEPKAQKVVSGTAQFTVSGDGKRVAYAIKEQLHLADIAADAKGKPVVTEGMRNWIDPREEWQQLFVDAWRIQRDFFYDAELHGVDWQRIRTQYGAMLADAVSRNDVSYIIREMIAELNVGHAYYWGGDVEDAPQLPVGLLGVDWQLAGQRYRVGRLVGGADWDVDARGPLQQPGMPDVTGKVLLSVNGVPVTTQTDPYAPFVGLAGKAVRVEFAGEGREDDEEAIVSLVVEPVASEVELRYRDWVEGKRSYVERLSGGRIGYVYVPNTGVDGQSELVRQYFGQITKEALIIDERWNGGGQIPTRFIELLNRPITNYWARRDGVDWPWPHDGHQGPKAMLINGLAGSGGDAFPHYFRRAGLGKLIGTRTWGGLVGISGNPTLIDGGYTSAPTFGFYEPDGTWGIEGHGVDPDIEVVDDPALMVDGGDPQIDAAIGHLLDELATRPYVRPKRPASPDRSGMGIPLEDR